MPSPSTSLATLRPDLATFEQFDLAMDRQGFIGHRVLPIINVGKQSGTFGKIPLKQLLQNKETKRNSGGGYNRGDWEFDDESYATKEQGWEEPIDDRESELYADYFDAELVSSMRAFDFVLRAAERRAAALLFNTTTFGVGQQTAAGTAWSNHSGSAPVDNVEAAVRKVWGRCGRWPNALILNRHNFRHARQCEQVLENSRSQGFMDVRAGNITAQHLATVFDLDQVIVAGGVQNTANEGQDASLSNIWSNSYAMVAVVARTNDIREPCIGRTFHWAGDGSQPEGVPETYRDERVRGDVVRVRHEVQEKLLYVEAAELITGVSS